MADAKDATQRRVYVFPNELVERITAFQQDRGLPSEVEAVRRLLDEALMARDTPDLILQRMVEKLKQTRIVSDAAKDVLVGHPQVESIAFRGEILEFKLTSGHVYQMDSSGRVLVQNGYDSWEDYDGHLPRKPNKATKNFDLDDEIPF